MVATHYGWYVATLPRLDGTRMVEVAMINILRRLLILTALCGSVVGCGGGDDPSNEGPPGGGDPSSYTLGGTISGLDAPGLVLSNGGQTIAPTVGATAFTFPTPLAAGTGYSVMIQAQPTGTACAVSAGSGTISATVTSVQVACTPRQYVYGSGSLGLYGFSVDFADGDLDALQGSPFSLAGGQPVGSTGGAVADPLGHFVIAGGRIRWIEPQTGAISDTGWDSVSVTGATKAAIDPTGRFLYVANASQGIYGFGIDRDSGLLTPVPGSPFEAGLQARSVTVDRTGSFVYVLNRQSTSTTISAYSIDQVTGILSPVPGSPFSTGVTFSGGGTDPHACDIVANPNGNFIHAYSLDDEWGRIYSYAVNTTTGELSGPTQTGPSASTNPSSLCGMLALHPSGSFLYATKMDGQRALYTFHVDLTNGTYLSKASDLLTHTYAVGETLFHEDTVPQHIAIDPSGQYLYVSGGNRLARFDIETEAGDVLYIGRAISFPGGGGIVTTRPRH
jgi:6-phosphogluconolactonase